MSENVLNTIEALLAKCESDKSYIFAPEAQKLLVDLQKSNLQKFESTRHQLKMMGCRVGELDKLLMKMKGSSLDNSVTATSQFLDVVKGSLFLFHNPDGVGFVDIEIEGHRETLSLKGKVFQKKIGFIYYMITKRVAPPDIIRGAQNILEEEAKSGPEHDVHLRTARLDNKLYVDLCDKDWSAIEIDSIGWRIVERPPVRFRRVNGMRPLPIPSRDGSIDLLRRYLNFESLNAFKLTVGFILSALRADKEYPILVFAGEQGAAKSTGLSVIRSLFDPSSAPLRALPRDERDMYVSANSSGSIVFDNISSLATWQSDSLCRLSTGAGFSARQLYTDDGEVIFTVSRPIMMNGIGSFVVRPDLADRAIFVSLKHIPDDQRIPTSELWAQFEVDRPRILGALLDGMVVGLRRLSSISPKKLPRMAEFGKWATACETAYWQEGDILNAYFQHLKDAVEDVLESDPLATSIRSMLAHQTQWEGTATSLMAALASISDAERVKASGWPSTPSQCVNSLNRMLPFLRRVGISVEFRRQGKARTKMIRLTINQP
jgi:hypothetical protein